MQKDVNLVEITPFKAPDGDWWLRLGYEYEDEKGVHSYIIPKARLPLCKTELPNIHYPSSPVSHESPFIFCGDAIYLEKGFFEPTAKHPAGILAYTFDRITIPAVREMTLDEIEKVLGYKVKIIEKEASNGTNNL